jgi:acyl-CoA synthetase (AMP-forming)/AMP-acid ligase II
MALAEQIDKAGVTHVFANPPLVHLLMAYRKENKNAFATLRHVISGGALVEEKMAKQFHQLFDFQVATVYGMSEVGCVAVSDGEPCINGYSGRLLTGYQGRVMSTEGKELPLGKMGILWIKKPFKEFGYTDLPEISAKQFDGDWFLTGDMGHLDDQGNVFLAGVRSGRINVGGEKVDPGFVEMELKKCDGVEEAVVFGVPHSVYGEVVHAAVSGSNLEEETLREQLRTRVDPASLPRKIECTTTPLKRTPSGKISRVLYRQLFVDLQN